MLGYNMISMVFSEEECGFIPALARKLKIANGTNEILFSAESSPDQLASLRYIDHHRDISLCNDVKFSPQLVPSDHTNQRMAIIEYQGSITLHIRLR